MKADRSVSDQYDIRRDGHAITGQSEQLGSVPKVEMTEGKLFNSDADRLHVLALLLESVGIDAAIRLGPPRLWQEAIEQVHGAPQSVARRRDEISRQDGVMSKVSSLLETSLYVEDFDVSQDFYRDLFSMTTLMADDRMRALSIDGRTVLLLFARGRSAGGEPTPRGLIPGHDGHGTQHLAFAIEAADVDAWRDKLAANQIEIISTVRPEQGGISLYFRDPDHHLIELATREIWNV